MNSSKTSFLSSLSPPFRDNLPPEAEKVVRLQWQLQQFESLPRDAQRSLVSKQFKFLLSYAKRFSPFWAERLQSLHPNGRTLKEALQEVPVLRREDLRSNYENLKAKSPQLETTGLSETVTSGSTGIPVRTLHVTELRRRYQQASILLTFRWHGIDPQEPFGTLLGKAQDDEHLPLSAPFSWLGPVSTGFARCTLHREHQELYDYCAQRKPTNLYCGPEPLVGMARYALTSARRDLRPRIALTIGSTVSKDMREIVKDGLGTTIVDTYLSEETGVIALQCPRHDHYHVLSPMSFVEILNEENEPCKIGQPGRVLVTSMQSYAMPLIRYEIGDIAERGSECDCGMKLPVIRSIWGRTSHILTNPDGRKTYAKIYARSFEKLSELIEYRFVLHQNRVIDAQIRAKRRSAALEENIIKTVQQALSYPYPTNVRYVDRIDWGSSWKQENFSISNIPPPAISPH